MAGKNSTQQRRDGAAEGSFDLQNLLQIVQQLSKQNEDLMNEVRIMKEANKPISMTITKDNMDVDVKEKTKEDKKIEKKLRRIVESDVEDEEVEEEVDEDLDKTDEESQEEEEVEEEEEEKLSVVAKGKMKNGKFVSKEQQPERPSKPAHRSSPAAASATPAPKSAAKRPKKTVDMHEKALLEIVERHDVKMDKRLVILAHNRNERLKKEKQEDIDIVGCSKSIRDSILKGRERNRKRREADQQARDKELKDDRDKEINEYLNANGLDRDDFDFL